MAAPVVPHDSRPRRSSTRPSRGARRFGYLVAAAINLTVFALIHVSPGWQAVPFLADSTRDVLPWVDLQLLTSVAVNLVWVVADPRWLRALGEVVTSVIGLVAVARILQVFPFEFAEGSRWPGLVTVVLWLAVVGSAIGVLINVGRLVRALARLGDPTES